MPGTGEITRRRALRIGFVEQDVPAGLLDLPLAEAVRSRPAAGRAGGERVVGRPGA
jgi:hypothetical protein